MVGTQTVLSILDEAAAAIGGWTALQSIRRVHLDSEGQDWEPWQAYDIGGTVDASTFRIATDLDLGAGASQVEMDAEVVYPWPHRVAYIEITDAEAGMLADLSLGAVAITRLRRKRYVLRAPMLMPCWKAGHRSQSASDTMKPTGGQRSRSLTIVRQPARPMRTTIRYWAISLTASNGLIGGMWVAFVCLTDCGT
jgi:hypothetical protein